MDAFCEETGLTKFANFAMARKQAKQLAAADFTPDEVRLLLRWLKTQEWITSGISLGLCLNQADKFRLITTHNPATDSGPPTTLTGTDRFNYERQKWIEANPDEAKRKGLA